MAPRVLIAGFKHETNTFSKLPTDLAAYRARGLFHGEDMRAALGSTNTEIAGFLDACETHGWEPVLTLAADATPSGKVTRDAFDHVWDTISQTIDQGGTPDAVLLQLHGAMVCEHADDGESALLSLLRKRVGRDVPIAVTHDLHANVTDATGALSDILVSYRTYPHIDQYDTAIQCAGLLKRMMDGEIRPKVHVARGPQLDGVDHGRTTAPGPMLDILEIADQLKAEHGLLAVSINAGFPWADVAYAGPTAIVVADEGREDAAAAACDVLRAEMWRTRNDITIDFKTAGEALDIARAKGRPGSPVVLADFADNPGGGGYTDSTGLLRAMIESDLDNAAFSPLYDPESVKACEAAGEGAEITLEIGGKLAPELGAPIRAEGTVAGLYDGQFKLTGPMSTGVPMNLGPAAVFKTGGIDVVLVSRRAQNFDREYYRAFGIDPMALPVLGLKSAQHFRADYAPIASEIVVVDEGGGITSHNFKALTYDHLRRPIWPLDMD